MNALANRVLAFFGFKLMRLNAYIALLEDRSRIVGEYAKLKEDRDHQALMVRACRDLHYPKKANLESMVS